jgi:hypothetical protein
VLLAANHKSSGGCGNLAWAGDVVGWFEPGRRAALADAPAGHGSERGELVAREGMQLVARVVRLAVHVRPVARAELLLPKPLEARAALFRVDGWSMFVLPAKKAQDGLCSLLTEKHNYG